MNKVKDLLQTILTLAIILGISTVLYLYTSGYRLQKSEEKTIDLTQTGMVNAKSIPEAATVYLDGEIVTATNDTIAGIEPGMHTLKIVRKGFVDWEKEIEVFPELVTDITAVLVSQSPRIEPLTNTGARLPIISPTMNKLAYFSEDDAEPGIYVVPLGGFGGISLFKSNPNVAIKDTRVNKFSQGVLMEWSPDETNILMEGPNSVYYLVDLQKNTAETTASPNLVRETWRKIIEQKRVESLEKLEIDQDIRDLGLSDNAIWSPDEKKFLHVQQNGDKTTYKVYNLEKPIPIGEKVENLVFELNSADPQPKISWYSDSFHLILVEGDPVVEKRGVISLIRIDGTNKTEIYSNTLLSDNVYSTPGGDKVIISTSFKSNNQIDLYTVSIR
ncbi:PEGA domain-containing protein [candidate division WWE3 bacterium]|uniref:PEGA domain-containing protein n=1 Tax=candidate division WWE3 bacterium TaxID=2053526 RepID=A0A3A4ZFT5_UNCKA|nr:MAG: PEGA domain-containing protein [candidate division WWE3 bacterium]